MRLSLLIAAAAVALAAGCERDEPARAPATSSAPPASSSSSAAGAPTTPTTPANTGAPASQAERSETNPVQGQVDPKQREQHKDFQQRGDGAGPTTPDTKPKN
jgi:hypothetical protein